MYTCQMITQYASRDLSLSNGLTKQMSKDITVPESYCHYYSLLSTHGTIWTNASADTMQVIHLTYPFSTMMG